MEISSLEKIFVAFTTFFQLEQVVVNTTKFTLANIQWHHIFLNFLPHANLVFYQHENLFGNINISTLYFLKFFIKGT